jgi:hypothetical protein
MMAARQTDKLLGKVIHGVAKCQEEKAYRFEMESIEMKYILVSVAYSGRSEWITSTWFGLTDPIHAANFWLTEAMDLFDDLWQKLDNVKSLP